MRALPLHNVIWSVAFIGDLFCWRQKVAKPVSEVDEEDLDRSSHLVDVSDGGELGRQDRLLGLLGGRGLWLRARGLNGSVAAAVHVVEPIAAALLVVPGCARRTLVLLGHAVVAAPVNVAELGVRVKGVLLVFAVVIGQCRTFLKRFEDVKEKRHNPDMTADIQHPKKLCIGSGCHPRPRSKPEININYGLDLEFNYMHFGMEIKKRLEFLPHKNIWV